MNAIFKSGTTEIDYGTTNMNWTNPAIDRTEWQIENVRATLKVFIPFTLQKAELFYRWKSFLDLKSNVLAFWCN